MKTWKQAWALTTFEYRTTPPSYVQFFLLLGFGLYILISTFINGENQATLGSEWLFFIVIVIFPYTLRSDHIRGKHIGNKKWASPQLVLTQTLPIAHKTIATHRMLSYMTSVILMNALFFTLLYGLSPYMRSIAPLSTYVIFAFMWICLAVVFGGFLVHAEAALYVLTYLFFGIFVLFPLALIVAIILFYRTYTKGMIQWMLDVATTHPFLTVIGSILLAVIGWVFHIHVMMRKIAKTDY